MEGNPVLGPEQVDPLRGRWAQLSYTSFDAGNGASGGWQVKDTRGDLTATELEFLRSRVVTQFNADSALSNFPDARELRMMPRRFSYVALSDGRAGYWHSVMAGRDATGRPGNVFSHVVLDRRSAESGPAIRPIELWGSTDLETPYGPEKVMLAALPVSDHPQFGSGRALEQALSLLFDPDRWRLGLYCVLLDAVHAAMGGGRCVVLVTDTPDGAAAWIGAVSVLTSAKLARALNFSVYERAEELDAALSANLHLVCIPRADASRIKPSDDFVFLDENEAPSLGEYGGEAHRTQAGSTVVATHWSELAQGTFVDRETAMAAIRMIDEIAVQLEDTVSTLEWPLAMSAVCLPDFFADYQDEAVAVLKHSSPDALRKAPELLDLAVSSIQATAVGHAEAAWKNLKEVKTESIVRDLLTRHYIGEAILDGDWLSGQISVPLPVAFGPDALSPDLRAAARSALLETVSNLGTGASEMALVTGYRLLDFMVRAHLVEIGAGDEPLDDAILRLLDQVFSEVVDDDKRTESFLAKIPPVPSNALLSVVQDVVGSTERFHLKPVGSRMPSALARWLSRPLVAGNPVQAPPELPGGSDEMELELLIWRVLHDGETGSGYRTRIMDALLDPTAVGNGEVLAEIQEIREPWTTKDLLYLEDRFAGALGREHFRPNLWTEAWSPSLESLARLLETTAHEEADTGLSAMAKLRTLVSGEWLETPNAVELILRNAHILLQSDPSSLQLPEVAAEVVLAAFLDAESSSSGTQWSPELAGVVRTHVFGASEPRLGRLRKNLLAREDGQLQLGNLGELALATSPGYPGRPAGAKALALAGTRVVDRATGVEQRLLDVAYDWVLAGRKPAPGKEGLDPLLEKSWSYYSLELGDRQAEKSYYDLEKFAKAWLKGRRREMGLPEPDNSMKKVLGVFKNSTRKER